MFGSSNRSSFNFREIMDHQKILLVKLDKGKLKDSADLLGSLILAKIQMAAFSRTNVQKDRRVPFYLYIDEFQNFASESFAVVLSEARKYGLSLIMAHQTLAQISPELRSLILGNAGIQVYFRVSRQDAQVLAKEGFEYSGYEVKSRGKSGPRFWSYAEEWEHKIGELQKLPPRICYIKHKIEGGVIPVKTVEITPAWEVLETGESDYQEFIGKIPFGGKYLVPRAELVFLSDERQKLISGEVEPPKPKQIEQEVTSGESVPAFLKKSSKETAETELELSAEERRFLEYISEHPGMFVTQIYKTLQLSGYKGDRLKESLIEKGFIVQEETREGLKGRLAKVLTVTKKASSVVRETPLAGKGGNNHKYLQRSIKEQAELYGWEAVIEERIPRSLESVDVALRKNDMSVAVEISSTTKAEHEIQNIRKCLDAGYDYVISVSSEDKRLQLLKKEFKKGLALRERERVKVSHPSGVKDLLRNLDSPGIVSEKAIVSGQITKQKQLLDTKDASALLGISINTLYEWIIQNKVPFVKVGRLVKFRQEDLEAWLKKRTQAERRDFL